jgi:hypothetical protein
MIVGVGSNLIYGWLVPQLINRPGNEITLAHSKPSMIPEVAATTGNQRLADNGGHERHGVSDPFGRRHGRIRGDPQTTDHKESSTKD